MPLIQLAQQVAAFWAFFVSDVANKKPKSSLRVTGRAEDSGFIDSMYSLH
jgi:hypothetical protein